MDLVETASDVSQIESEDDIADEDCEVENIARRSERGRRTEITFLECIAENLKKRARKLLISVPLLAKFTKTVQGRANFLKRD